MIESMIKMTISTPNSFYLNSTRGPRDERRTLQDPGTYHLTPYLNSTHCFFASDL